MWIPRAALTFVCPPLPLDAVDLADDFWEPRRRINREVTLPSQYKHLEETGRLDNFRRASGKTGGEYQGIYFNASDVYKWLEAAAWTLAEGSDPELEQMVDAERGRRARRPCPLSVLRRR